jgi:hypothetical protein
MSFIPRDVLLSEPEVARELGLIPPAPPVLSRQAAFLRWAKEQLGILDLDEEFKSEGK